MICRNKIGNLHTSYEKINNYYHLKAFFGVNVACAMNEVLKFPGLFNLSELSEYLDGVEITPKRALITFNKPTSYYSKYLAENKSIEPKLLKISNIDDGIVYFYFDQKFEIDEKKKFKVKISVFDKSIQKAIEAKNKFIKLNIVLSNIKNNEEITEEMRSQILLTSSLAEKIRKKKNEVYKSILDKELIDIRKISMFIRELKKEIKIIDETLNYNLKQRNDKKKDKPENSGVNTFMIFEKEFKKEISFRFTKERFGRLNVRRLPSLPIIKMTTNNTVEFQEIESIHSKKIDGLPSFKTSFSKQHSFEHKQTLRIKAENFNLDFIDKTKEETNKKINFITDSTNEQIYVLNGHYNNDVTSEIFVSLSEIKQNLLSGSSYLCKTEMIEAENQYFILEV